MAPILARSAVMQETLAATWARLASSSTCLACAPVRLASSEAVLGPMSALPGGFAPGGHCAEVSGYGAVTEMKPLGWWVSCRVASSSSPSEAAHRSAAASTSSRTSTLVCFLALGFGSSDAHFTRTHWERPSFWLAMATFANSAAARCAYATNAMALVGIRRTLSSSPHTLKSSRTCNSTLCNVSRTLRSKRRSATKRVRPSLLKLPTPSISSRWLAKRSRPKMSCAMSHALASAKVGRWW
mmetsp:Transcript_113389/g.315679  ORF Transcript_113389/g.315679 Transcript_113389/m.315679 type:complete len:241 (+) Transcript_113389:51-773(+)